MVLIGILVGLFFLFALVGGVYMYFYAVVRDHSGKRQENLWEKEIAPHPGYSEENRKKIIAGEKYIKSHITEVVRIKSHDGLTLVGHVVEPKILLRAEFSSWFTAIVHTLFMISPAQSRQ